MIANAHFHFLLLFLMLMGACSQNNTDSVTQVDDREEKKSELTSQSINTLSDDERSEGWILLFDGESLEGWHHYLGDSVAGWQVVNGILSTPGGQDDIVTNEEFGDFEMTLDWKIMEGGNSGIFYYVIEDPDYGRMHMTGPEFQIIDDENYPQELKDNQKTGANSDVLAPEKFNAHPPGNWNSTRIVSREGKIEHWLNGEKILAFDAHSPEWKNMVANSKFSEFAYAQKFQGKIGLQDHGGPVEFRNIKIKKYISLSK